MRMTQRLSRPSKPRPGFVLGTNIDASELHEAEVITAYKGQSQFKGAFGFSKPHCFSSRRGLSKNPTGLKGCSW